MKLKKDGTCYRLMTLNIKKRDTRCLPFLFITFSFPFPPPSFSDTLTLFSLSHTHSYTCIHTHSHCLFHTLVSQIHFLNTVLGPVVWKCVTLTPTCSKHTHTHTLKCHPTHCGGLHAVERALQKHSRHTHTLPLFSLVAQWVLVRP